MPNFYAHIRFCLAVRKQLPPRLRAILTAERDSFLCGDSGRTLFIFIPAAPGPEQSGRRDCPCITTAAAAAMEPFRRPVAEEWPFAVSFSAGYLLHYLLDSRCHPYVNAVAAQGEFTHFALEGEYDRYLLRQDALDYREALPERQMRRHFTCWRRRWLRP